MRVFEYFKHELKFSFEARTSRGKIDTHIIYIIKAYDQGSPLSIGYGEAAPLKGLSIDAHENFEQQLQGILERLNHHETIEPEELNQFPSIKFALETAILDLKGGAKQQLFHNTFITGSPIWINGLVWMSDIPNMLEEAQTKVAKGFSCIKFKVGAHDFDSECRMLETFRKNNLPSKVEIRLDANGAFDKEDALSKLKELKRFSIHSIEQPIAVNQTDWLERICKESPIAVALDEELIGKIANLESAKWLKMIKPSYLILKPTLLGGLAAAEEWIQLAEKNNLGWWATSALESNIGLNAIAQWVAQKPLKMPQGLGTGMLYENNFPSPLLVDGEQLFYLANRSWQITHAGK
jgi:o-succinylbenzoate synthase